MASLSTTEPAGPKDTALDAAAAQMAQLVEEYYDEIGLPVQERDQRVASAGDFIKTVAAARYAKSA